MADITSILNTHISVNIPQGNHYCKSGHVFVHAGAFPSNKVPEGFPCSCGVYQAHWAVCGACGTEILQVVPAFAATGVPNA